MIESARLRPGALALALSSLLLAAFPLVRPFFPMPAPGDTAGIAAAADGMASTAWVASHLMAGLGFALLPLGLLGLRSALSHEGHEGRAFLALVLATVGCGLILIIVGAEAFGLSAVAGAYREGQATDLPALLSRVRSPAVFAILLLGLFALAVAVITFATAIWRSDVLPRWGGVALAVGLTLWLPLLPQAPRIADGFMIGIGGSWLALALWRLDQANAVGDG